MNAYYVTLSVIRLIIIFLSGAICYYSFHRLYKFTNGDTTTATGSEICWGSIVGLATFGLAARQALTLAGGNLTNTGIFF